MSVPVSEECFLQDYFNKFQGTTTATNILDISSTLKELEYKINKPKNACASLDFQYYIGYLKGLLDICMQDAGNKSPKRRKTIKILMHKIKNGYMLNIASDKKLFLEYILFMKEHSRSGVSNAYMRYLKKHPTDTKVWVDCVNWEASRDIIRGKIVVERAVQSLPNSLELWKLYMLIEHNFLKGIYTPESDTKQDSLEKTSILTILSFAAKAVRDGGDQRALDEYAQTLLHHQHHLG